MFVHLHEHVVIGPVNTSTIGREHSRSGAPKLFCGNLTHRRTVVHGKELQVGSGLRNHPITSYAAIPTSKLVFLS